MRHPDTFLENGRFAESAPNPTQADQRAKSTGVSGVPLLSLLPSMICPLSFPLDFMHLIYENVGPNMIEFWCGTHKNLDHDGQGYRIELGVWKGICEATAAAGRTTPAAYGPALPDMSAEGTRLSADMKGFWFQFLGPVLLAKAFPDEKVYKHFVKLVTIITRCLQFSITRAEVHALRQDIIKWVKTYEEIYYQRDPDRLSACPVTIHSLLHIVDGILLLGPVWVYWSFAMERFCGKLGKLIRSRRFPFSHLDNQVLAHAQMVQIKNRYHLQDVLSLRPPKSDVVWEFRIPLAMYKGYALVAPRVSKPVIAPGLFRKIAAALVTRFSSNNASQREDLMTIQRAEELLGTCMIETWGRVRVLKGGDTMLASELVIQESEDRRNATFVKVRRLRSIPFSTDIGFVPVPRLRRRQRQKVSRRGRAH
ncbi:hypothetical protein NMY22_g18601 [Coprinellus aureogranulatus]|nr:hypothetical protein NMY22_g18601 [Coprinellus aureogranulatus]